MQQNEEALVAIEIRGLMRTEWPVLKQLRLRALREAPDAFSPTYAEHKDQPDAYWQSGAERLARPHARMFVAWMHDAPKRDESAGDDAAMGLISAVRDRAGIGHLGAFWVDPRARGTGLGTQLFDAAMQWLEHSQCSSLELSVTEGNDAAEAMYRRRGFARDGRTEPHRLGAAQHLHGEEHPVRAYALARERCRNTCPGRLPVCSPLRNVTSPLTNVAW